MHASTDESSFDWEELLLAVEDRKLIPVIGRELLVSDDGSRLPETWAERVAERLGVDLGDAPLTLNGVSVRYLEGAGSKAESRKRKLLKAVHEVVSEEPSEIPKPLLELAEVTQLSTYLTTTFDDLMVRALAAARGGAAPTALAYHLEAQPDDLPPQRASSEPCVYQLFGALSSRTDFAVTDEDQLERLHHLQDPRKQPPLLFDELADKHLLFLGCGFQDGLARILMRTLINDRLFEEGRRSKLVDRRAQSSAELLLFLRHCGSEWYDGGTSVDFVAELARRWRDSGLATATEPPQADASTQSVGASVFISYKSQDLDRVRPIADALAGARIYTWFDKKDIDAGDQWSAEIENGLRRCTLFMPVLSKNAQVGESVVIQEWKRALKRSEGIAPDTPFILPVLLDQIDDFTRDETGDIARIPRQFFELQAIQLAAGEPDDGFVDTVRAKMREAQLAGVGR